MLHDADVEYNSCNFQFADRVKSNKQANHRKHNGEMTRCQVRYAIFIIVQIIEFIFIIIS